MAMDVGGYRLNTPSNQLLAPWSFKIDGLDCRIEYPLHLYGISADRELECSHRPSKGASRKVAALCLVPPKFAVQ